MIARDRVAARMERLQRRREEDLAALDEERRKARRDRLNKMRGPAEDKGREVEAET